MHCTSFIYNVYRARKHHKLNELREKRCRLQEHSCRSWEQTTRPWVAGALDGIDGAIYGTQSSNFDLGLWISPARIASNAPGQSREAETRAGSVHFAAYRAMLGFCGAVCGSDCTSEPSVSFPMPQLGASMH